MNNSIFISQVMFPSYRGYMASVELGSEDIRKVRIKSVFPFSFFLFSKTHFKKGAKFVWKAKRNCRQGRTGKLTTHFLPFFGVLINFAENLLPTQFGIEILKVSYRVAVVSSEVVQPPIVPANPPSATRRFLSAGAG